MKEPDDVERLSETEKIRLIVELKEKLKNSQHHIHKLEELQNIFRIWVRLRQKLFPSNCSGTDVRGIDLVMLDADVAGCISTFLTKGQLDQRQKEALYFCNDCLNTVTLELQGYEGWYYRQLKTLTSAVINFQQEWG